jgi:hypothetical protein
MGGDELADYFVSEPWLEVRGRAQVAGCIGLPLGLRRQPGRPVAEKT